MKSVRRSDFDVTNTVQVSVPAAVLEAVEALYRPFWPELEFAPLEQAFEHFERLFAGQVPGYFGVDTVYHYRQHSLDMTLAMARLLVGHEITVEPPQRFGAERAIMALVTRIGACLPGICAVQITISAFFNTSWILSRWRR